MCRAVKIIADIIAALPAREDAAVLYSPDEDYAGYLERTAVDAAALASQRHEAETFLQRPRFTVLIVSGADDKKRLELTRASLEAQSYGLYELVTLPDAGSGGYVLPVDAGDTFAPDALFSFAREVELEPAADLIFADEDVRLKDGSRAWPRFKPEFSNITFTSYDSVGRPLAVSRAVFDASGCTGGEDAYAFALRCVPHAHAIRHIPRVLLSRASRPAQVITPTVMAAAAAFVSERGSGGTVSPGMYAGSIRPRARVKDAGVSVVVPNVNAPGKLRRLLKSIEANTLTEGVELIIADGGSAEAQTLDYYDRLEQNRAAKIVRCGAVSRAVCCNLAASSASKPTLAFMDSSIEVLTPDWNYPLLEQLFREGVGAVGPKFIDESGNIAFTGGVAGLCGLYSSPYAGESDDTTEARKNGFINAVRRVSLLSDACIMLRADTFFTAGGFDESFRDQDAGPELCVRLSGRYLASVFTPFTRVRAHAPLVATSLPDNVKTRMYDVLRPLIIHGDPWFNQAYAPDRHIPAVKGNGKN